MASQAILVVGANRGIGFSLTQELVRSLLITA